MYVTQIFAVAVKSFPELITEKQTQNSPTYLTSDSGTIILPFFGVNFPSKSIEVDKERSKLRTLKSHQQEIDKQK